MIFARVLARRLMLALARSWDFRILRLWRSLERSLRLFLLFRKCCFRILVGLVDMIVLRKIVSRFVMRLLGFRIGILLDSLLVA
jgi:hypothetical protein